MTAQDIVTTQNKDELLYKVILGNDLSSLTPMEKVQHVRNICDSIGLNPLTKPIQLLKFQGKEIPYMTKDGTEQIRNNHQVSIMRLETEILKNDLYIVKAYASKPDGRQDCSTSAISLSNLKGDAIGNAMKKCETQAKRRVTLSICGLGMLDETEIENIPYETKINNLEPRIEYKKPELDEELLEETLEAISRCITMEELKNTYFAASKHPMWQAHREAKEKIVSAKDEKKKEIERSEFLADYEEEKEGTNETTI